MRKITAALAAFVLLASATAQVKLAVKGGYNLATSRAVYSGVKQSTGFTNGYGIGALVKMPFDGILHFSPSVMINKRGFIIKPLTGTNVKEQYAITYVDLIPSLSIDFEKGENSFVISLGPDIAFTNFGKLKTTGNNGVTTSQKIKFGYGSIGWFDIGLNASIGYHMKKVFVELGYMNGLASINNNEELDQRNIRNRMLSLNIGYYFKQTAH
jgi:Outer membrane protein beta-barrel domain